MERLAAALSDRYTIERELGQGGMATVYLAQDLKHDRKVAIKVLRPELAAVLGAERFVQEIKTTANLQHPHILPLFDSGQAGGRADGQTGEFLYYVMPYVEGETLREKLNRETQLGIEEAVKITTEAADALDYAHRHNVIHRDIKPENILLHDGRPMVADFGIALAISAAAGNRMTETGLSLGTPHYMSPEQATAEKNLTNRSDIYSLGAVLYEMLTGDPPHTGSSAQQIIMKIVTDEPRSVTEVRKSVPPSVAATTAKALEKLPADRFESAKAFAQALGDPHFRTDRSHLESVSTDARVWKGVAIGAMVAAALLLSSTIWAWRRPASDGVISFDAGLPESAPLRLYLKQTFDVSGDGRFLIYEAAGPTPRLWYRSLQNDEARPISGTEGARNPLVSPQGDRIAFVQDGELITTALDGSDRTTVDQVGDLNGGDWLADGRILLADEDGTLIRWFDAERELRADSSYYCILPEPFPGDDDRLFCAGGGAQYAYVVDLTQRASELPLRISGSEEEVLKGSNLNVIDGGYLTYVSIDGDLRATTIDLTTLTVGRSVTVVEGLRREAYSGLGNYLITHGGTLVYVPGGNAAVGEFVERRGQADPLPLPIEPAEFLRFDISSDGRRMAAVVEGPRGQHLNIYNAANEWRRSEWQSGFFIGQPMWNPAATRVLATIHEELGRSGATVIGDPEATAAPTRLMTAPGRRGFWPTSFLADSLIMGEDEGWVLVTLDITRSPVVVDTLVTEPRWFNSLSPDGRWLSTGPYGVYRGRIEPFPSMSQRLDLSGDVLDPQWLSPTELVYRSIRGEFYRADVDSVSGRPGRARPWFVDPQFVETPGRSYTVGPDESVIYVRTSESTTAPYFRIRHNWVADMKRAVDEANR